MKVLGQDYYLDNQTLIKKLEIETGKKELLWEWDSFFQERYEMYNKIYFKNLLKSLSTTYCIYEYFGGDVDLEWSAIVLDINNGIIYKIHQNHIVRNELKCNLTNIINLNSKFNNSYIEGEIARGYSVSLITLVNNSEISWVLTGGSITSKLDLSQYNRHKKC